MEGEARLRASSTALAERGAAVPRGTNPDYASAPPGLGGLLASFHLHNVKQRSFFVPARVAAPGFIPRSAFGIVSGRRPS
jgi:hypothetical protein